MISLLRIDDNQWDITVKKVENYDVFYLNDYVKAFQNENVANGEPILIVYEEKNEYAINVMFRRDIGKIDQFKNLIPEKKYYDLISPYGYGGFLGHISNYSNMVMEYSEFCRSHGYISEFFRFELFSDYFNYYSGYVETRTHNVVRDLTMPLDEMWMDFKQSVRKNVKRANKNGLEIIIDENDEYLEDFLTIYYSTMERTEAKQDYFFSKKFFQTVNQMKNNHCYFHVKEPENGKIISTELVLYGSENSYSYLGGTIREYFSLRPNDFLKFEIIKWAKDKGLKTFVFGGGYGSDDGIFQYKSHFAPNGIVDFYIGKQVWNVKKYDELCRIRGIESHSKSIEKAGFFPEYRQ